MALFSISGFLGNSFNRCLSIPGYDGVDFFAAASAFAVKSNLGVVTRMAVEQGALEAVAPLLFRFSQKIRRVLVYLLAFSNDLLSLKGKILRK